MATQTSNLKLSKPDLADNIPDSIELYNANFEVIDEQIADLNRYKGTIDDVNNTVNQVSAALPATLESANAYTDEVVGNIASILDNINGEVI